MFSKYNFTFPSQVENTFKGYSEVVRLYSETKDCEIDDIYLDLSSTGWFEANIAAAIGAILSSLQGNLCDIKFSPMQTKVETILKKNNFLSSFGGDKIGDTYSSTIPYKKFDKTDIKAFQAYLDTELLSSTVLPDMTPALKKKINESILEIFINASTHSGCKHIFSCGQYFHSKKRLDFTIANLGTTIRKNVSDFLGDSKMSAIDAIEWAIIESHTTRKGDVPGGLGLSTLLSFLELNQGKIHIVSSNAYWLKGPAGYKFSKLFENRLKGTIVNIEFNINDTNTYMLSTERTDDTIF